MDQPGNQFFSCPVLSVNQNRSIGRSGFLNIAPQFLDGLTFSDQVVFLPDGFAKLDVFFLQFFLHESILDREDDFFQ